MKNTIEFSEPTSGRNKGRICQSLLSTLLTICFVPLLAQSQVTGDPWHGSHRCKPGFVWREAVPQDHVCVTPQTRDHTRQDNTMAAQRKVPGSDVCKQGFVWREVVPTDHVCVTPQTRAAISNDNVYAASRWVDDSQSAGSGSRGGPAPPPAPMPAPPGRGTRHDTCKQGFVWREAQISDHVCVTPQTRARTRAENYAGGRTTVPGSDVCKQGYVWREAVRTDHICVTPQSRAAAADDNRHAAERRMN